MVIGLLCKKNIAGGFFSARLFYLVTGLFFFLFRGYSQSTLDQISIPLEKIETFSITQNNELAEIYLQTKGGKIELPGDFSKHIVSYEKNKIVLKYLSKERPEIIVTSKEIIFKNAFSSSEPDSIFSNSTIPSYPLGPGDSLVVEIYGIEEMRNEVTVDPQGSITLPILDKIEVQGLTVDKLQDVLKEKYSEYINDPQINILLKEYGSRYVNVIGEISAPSRIPLKRALRLLDAISLAGGFTEKSGDIEIQRRDNNGSIQKKRIMKESLLGANSEKDNLFLLDGDVVNVLQVSSVYLSGEVQHPQSVLYDKELTLLKAIAKAGGFTQWANKSNIIILRKINDKTETIKVDAGKVEKGKIEDPQLYPNDYIIVKERKLF